MSPGFRARLAAARLEASMTREVRLIHGTDRIKRLAQRPDISSAVRQIRADMAEADRAYAERESPLAISASSTSKESRPPG